MPHELSATGERRPGRGGALLRRCQRDHRDGEPATLRRVVNPSFADENPLPGVDPGRAGLEDYLVSLHDADPGLRLEADVLSANAQLGGDPGAGAARGGGLYLSATLGEARTVWSPIEVFRITDGVVVGRWGQTDGLTLARPLAAQTLALPIPTPRVVSLMRVTQAPGTRWDAPRVDGPRLLVLQAGVLDVQAVPGSVADSGASCWPRATVSDGGPRERAPTRDARCREGLAGACWRDHEHDECRQY